MNSNKIIFFSEQNNCQKNKRIRIPVTTMSILLIIIGSAYSEINNNLFASQKNEEQLVSIEKEVEKNNNKNLKLSKNPKNSLYKIAKNIMDDVMY